jgi:outer membrane receptor protein involved in Fe transport
VTGLTVVDDKYVFVRGLGERYSNSRLNSSTLPSPDPEKRIVPFDIFPSSLLDNVVITKGFVPNLPGDFAGGCIQLTTKEFTEESIMRLNLSYGYNSFSTFNGTQTYQGGKWDLLGFDDGTRDMPEQVREASEVDKIVEGGQFGGGFTAEEIEAFGESFKNVWSPHPQKAPVNQSYGLSLGNQFDFLGRPFGLIGSLTYKNNYSFHEEERFYYIKGPEGLEARHHYQDFETSNLHVLWGGILNASYKVSPNHKIGIKTTYTRTADDEVRAYGMFPNRDHNLDEICTRLRWVERSLLSTEISGEHRVSAFGSELGWRSSYSLATRDEPDTRETLYESDVGLDSFRLADESNSGRRFFSYLVDHNLDMGGEWKIPFKQWSSLPAKLEVGGSFVYKDRTLDSRRFRYKPEDFHEVDIYQAPEAIFSAENIGPDGFQLEEVTRATDNYSGEHRIYAGYVLVDMPITPGMRFAGGARLEHSNEEVTTFDLFNPTAEPVVGDVTSTDLFPSVNLTQKLSEEMNLRAGFSQTVSRPSFRELSMFNFTDIGGHAVVGNPDLKRALMQNYDFRWEWYPGFAEHVSAAAFYKHFTDPIEKTIYHSSEITHSWQNAKIAYNYGGEFEVRKNLGFIAPVFSNFAITGNLALIKSNVELYPEGIETTKERPLQGQSPYVVNLMTEYDNSQTGTRISASYNVSGRRIIEVGIAGIPDIYEEPFHKVDLVVTQDVGNQLDLKFAAKNLVDPEVRFTQGGMVQRNYHKGRSFSLGVSYSL